MNKTVIITGISGQDGYYLSKHLLSLDYRVVGVRRRTSTSNLSRLRTLMGSPNFHLVDGDVTDLSSIQNTVKKFQPAEFYNLAAQSHVALSWQYPETTSKITGFGVLNCLEAIRQIKPDCKFYQAGSSEQFGNPIINGKVAILNEDSPMNPESPYAASKMYGHHMTQIYRRSYNMFATVGILFNHESPLRGEEFVTRKITTSLARIKWGLQEHIELGNITASRDWGYAGDYVKAMHMMLQNDTPDDFVIATGKTHSVTSFFEACCTWFNLDKDKVYKFNPIFMRPKDVEILLGDSSKAQKTLGWKSECDFETLVDKMCVHDYHLQSPDPAYSKRADEFIY